MGTVPIARRLQIMDAAAQLFADHGFHNVSLTEIGRAVGISGPAVYRHFDKKDDILGAILVQISEFLLNEANTLGTQHTEPHELLEELVAAHVDFSVTRPELIILQWREFGNLRGEDRRTVRRLQRTYIDYWTAVLLKLKPALSIPEAGATVVAAFGLMNSTPFSASRLGPEESRPLLCTLTMDMFSVCAEVG